MEHELSTVEEKLEQIHSLPVPSGKVPPSSEQPTHSPLTTRHESSSSSGSDRGSDLSVVTTSSDNGAATTTERKEVTSGVSVDAETTTPLPPISEGATESDVFTTATDETNSSLDVNHANNSSGAKNNDTTESDGSVVKEEEEGEGTATTTDGVPPSPGPNDEDEEDEKTKNEKAIAALRSKQYLIMLLLSYYVYIHYALYCTARPSILCYNYIFSGFCLTRSCNSNVTLSTYM